MEMKKLKVATARMAGYTGVLGPVRFKDGVSEEYLPRHIRDRMAASMEFIEIDADGKEQPAGAQYRLISESAARAPVLAPLVRQTEEEKKVEQAKSALDAVTIPAMETRESLEKVVETGGIKALREIAARWGVKHRSIPVLIEMILGAQTSYLAKRQKDISAKFDAAAEKLKTTTPQPEAPVADEPIVEQPVADEPVDEVVSEKTSQAAQKIADAINSAAATGDLSAAITE